MNRYLTFDQFRKHAQENHKPETPLVTEDLVVLASHVPVVRALGGIDSRLVEFIITDESVDRASDMVKFDGWNTDAFEKNPVVLWAHSHYDPPVAKSTELVFDEKKRQLRSVAEFTPRDVNPLGYMVYQMYVQRFLHAVSVGFQPKEWTWVSSDSDGERARRMGIDYLKQELLEYSAVPVPANQNALAVARGMGIDTTPLKWWAEQILDEKSVRNLNEEGRREMEVIRLAASPGGQSLFLDLGKKQEEPAEDKVKALPTTWSCGTDGHAHESKAEAETCNKIDAGAADLATSLTVLTGVIKAGRVLSKKNETSLRNAVAELTAVLAQLDQEAEEEDEGEEEGKRVESGHVLFTKEPPASEVRIMIDSDELRAMIADGVKETLHHAMGRVD